MTHKHLSRVSGDNSAPAAYQCNQDKRLQGGIYIYIFFIFILVEINMTFTVSRVRRSMEHPPPRAAKRDLRSAVGRTDVLLWLQTTFLVSHV